MAPGPALETRNFRTRYGRYRNAPLAIRYAIGGEAAELALENAVGTGLRMLRRFGVDRIWPWEENPPRYPRELSRLVGFDVDHDAPFSITLEFGRPLAGWQSSGVPAVLSSPDDLRAFASGLVRGLAMLDRLGVVHRQILDNTVHWDARSRRVQINRFEYARREGEPRGRLARVRQPEERTARDWEAPEQILGGGLIDPRDDVFSVGCAILSMTAHGLSLGPDGLPDLSASGVPWLAYVLDGVFDPVDTRPTAADLLRRLGKSIARDDLPTREPDIFQEGRTEYDRIVARRDPQRSLAPRSALLRPVPITDDAPSPPWPPRNVPDRPTRPARRSSRRRPGPQR
jgi:serine/threonine protein kinase